MADPNELKLAIRTDRAAGLHFLLENDLIILRSYSPRQIERARDAILFQHRMTPLLDKVDTTDSELIAAVMVRDKNRIEIALTARQDAITALINAFQGNRRGIYSVPVTSFVETKEVHPEVKAETRPPVDGLCPDCRKEAQAGFGLAGGGYGSYWGCDCGYFYKKEEVVVEKVRVFTRDELSQLDDDTCRIINAWLGRGDGVAIYENKNMASAQVGARQYVSYGSAACQLEGPVPPDQLPDIGGAINWPYRLVGTYRGGYLIKKD